MTCTRRRGTREVRIDLQRVFIRPQNPTAPERGHADTLLGCYACNFREGSQRPRDQTRRLSDVIVTVPRPLAASRIFERWMGMQVWMRFLAFHLLPDGVGI